MLEYGKNRFWFKFYSALDVLTYPAFLGLAGILGVPRRPRLPFIGMEEKPIHNVCFAVTLLRNEDRRFFFHKGIDYISIIMELVRKAYLRRRLKGRSTITQQLAKNLFIKNPQSRTLFRKVREAVYAVMLEKHYSKFEIFESYLQNIPLGYHRGVYSFSRSYFQKEFSELSDYQAGKLVALLNGPNVFLKDERRWENRTRVMLGSLEAV
ncbi:MAG: biosynthetic peptidoglycan transglycosylase [bacterium]|nr:biosynthetic peptidoglycan transglycosylase [bacterium]